MGHAKMTEVIPQKTEELKEGFRLVVGILTGWLGLATRHDRDLCRHGESTEMRPEAKKLVTET